MEQVTHIQTARRRSKFWRWSNWSLLILILSSLATLLAFAAVPQYWAQTGMKDQLLQWLHLLATIALASTGLWSALAFLGVYFGPHNLWNHNRELGRGVFVVAGIVCIASILSYFIGTLGVWFGNIHQHIGCIVFAEGLFWFFDWYVIRRINILIRERANPKKDLDEEPEAQRGVEDHTWALDLRNQLNAWKCYVDRPATLAFAVLLIGGVYLERTDVLVDHMELELFSSGAIFFGLMTANLAFVAANNQVAYHQP